MRNHLVLFIFANCLLLSVSFVRVHSYRVVEYDLDTAASGKEEKWEKGEEEDYFAEDEEEKGGKEKKGYDSEHE